MAGRSRDTFKKRQKEVARAEKQRDKIARRMERKLHKGEETGDVDIDGVAISDDNLGDVEDAEQAAEEPESVREAGQS
jgi:hypothetical protein